MVFTKPFFQHPIPSHKTFGLMRKGTNIQIAMKGGVVQLTYNQIEWQRHLETTRHNRAVEDETRRSNLAGEGETNRANLAREKETHRSNVVNETLTSQRNAETARSNVANEQLKYQSNIINDTHYQRQDTETNRTNVANEKLRGGELEQKSRANDINELNAWTNARNAATAERNAATNELQAAASQYSANASMLAAQARYQQALTSQFLANRQSEVYDSQIKLNQANAKLSLGKYYETPYGAANLLVNAADEAAAKTGFGAASKFLGGINFEELKQYSNQRSSGGGSKTFDTHQKSQSKENQKPKVPFLGVW